MKQRKIFMIAIGMMTASILFSSCGSKTSSALTEEDKAVFQKMTVDAYEGFTKDDREPYMKRYSEDAIYMPPHAEAVTGLDAIRKFVYDYPKIHVVFPIVETLGNADFAMTHGTFEIKDTLDNFLDKGKYVSIWQKDKDGNWKVIRDIYNSDMPLPVSGDGNAAPAN